MHPDVHGNLNQSLAEATIPVRGKTLLHQHRLTEEIYHITQGMGTMTLGTKVFEVRIGDSVCIPPGTPHCIENTGSMPLVLLCCCSPAYSHEDTDLVSTLL
jgi:mannose-6-phosphate isomerase-like protein (cupin superfamily)